MYKKPFLQSHFFLLRTAFVLNIFQVVVQWLAVCSCNKKQFANSSAEIHHIKQANIHWASTCEATRRVLARSSQKMLYLFKESLFSYLVFLKSFFS